MNQMTYAQTMNQMAELKLTGMLNAYRDITDDPGWTEQGFEDKLAYLVDQEYQRRRDNRILSRVKEAKFKDQAHLHELIYTQDRNLSKDLVQRFATHRWIDNHENIIITGATGTGKSYLAQALGDHACRHGYRVQYYRLPDLLNELYFKRQTDRYLRMRQALQRRNLLILDDWGMATLDVLAGHEIAQIVEDRLGNRSTIVISQFPVNTWDRIFEDKTTADAVMDRLVHVAYTIELQGPSLRARAASRELQEYKEAMLE